MSKSKFNTALSKLTAIFQRNPGAGSDGSAIVGAEGESRLAGAFEGVAAVQRVLSERNRLAKLADEELTRESEIRAQLEDVDARRVKAIADSRVAGSSDRDPALEEIVSHRQRLEMAMADCKKVADDLRNRARALDQELETAIRMYKGDLGAFLNKLFEAAAAEFNKSAQESARCAVECVAIQRVMLRFLAGCPSGFEQQIYLPRAEPGNGKNIRPIVDSSAREFECDISSRSTEIIEMMREVGFCYRFDRTPL